MKTALNVSYTELGLLMAVFSGTTGLTQIPFGFLVDRFGAKFILIAGLAVEGIAFSCMGFAPGYPFLVALMFLAGAANGFTIQQIMQFCLHRFQKPVWVGRLAYIHLEGTLDLQSRNGNIFTKFYNRLEFGSINMRSRWNRNSVRIDAVFS